MDNNNGRRPTAAQGAEPSEGTGGGWRTHLTTCSRQRIVKKILETLKRHLPVSGKKGLEELKKEAVQFEERIYTAAMSQSEYLRKISLKMLTLESKNQNTIRKSLPPNPPGNNNSPSDSGERNGIVTSQGAEPFEETVGDWRTQLPTDSRQRIVNKIVETLKIHPSFSSQDGLEELKKIAVHREEKIYTAATSKSDYLRRMSLKILSMEYKSQSRIPISLPPNRSSNNNMPPDSGATIDSTAQTEHSNKGDRQEEVHQKSLENQIDPQIQSMNMQGSIPNMQLNNMEGMQHTSLSSLSRVLTSQQIMKLAQLKQASSLYLGQGNASALQQGNLTNFSWQNGVKMLQPNIPLQSNPNMLQHQHLRQQQEEMLKQLQMLQLALVQQMWEQQWQQQQQQLSAQMQAHQMPQVYPINDINELEIRQGTGGMSGVFQQHISGASLDSTAQTGNTNGGDWQEEVHQKIKAMKEMYFSELNEMHEKVTLKIQQYPLPHMSEQLAKLKLFKTMLERILKFLQVSKTNIIPWYKERLGSYEKQIINFISSNKMRKPIPPHQQGQLGEPLRQQPESQVSQIKAMKEMYLPDLNEMDQNTAWKLEQHDSLAQPPKSETL